MIIPSYIDDADRATGEWIDGTLKQLSRAATLAYADARIDTPEVHYDTFEHGGQTCAITVRWAEYHGTHK